MLVLSRKPGEKVLIGDQITVTVVRIGPNTVRIGIDAPRGMNIVRQELLLQIADDERLDDVVRSIELAHHEGESHDVSC
jgi:carbon storage regulator